MAEEVKTPHLSFLALCTVCKVDLLVPITHLSSIIESTTACCTIFFVSPLSSPSVHGECRQHASRHSPAVRAWRLGTH
jgi:hypothetical protein